MKTDMIKMVEPYLLCDWIVWFHLKPDNIKLVGPLVVPIFSI